MTTSHMPLLGAPHVEEADTAPQLTHLEAVPRSSVCDAMLPWLKDGSASNEAAPSTISPPNSGLNTLPSDEERPELCLSKDGIEPDLKHKPRIRSAYTSEQLAKLQDYFLQCQYPKKTMRKALSVELSLTEKQVGIWFQNRRVKMKKLGLVSHPKMGQPIHDESQTSLNDSKILQSQHKTKKPSNKERSPKKNHPLHQIKEEALQQDEEVQHREAVEQDHQLAYQAPHPMNMFGTFPFQYGGQVPAPNYYNLPSNPYLDQFYANYWSAAASATVDALRQANNNSSSRSSHQDNRMVHELNAQSAATAL